LAEEYKKTGKQYTEEMVQEILNDNPIDFHAVAMINQVINKIPINDIMNLSY